MEWAHLGLKNPELVRLGIRPRLARGGGRPDVFGDRGWTLGGHL